MSELVGRAESDNGWIRAACTIGAGLTELDIDERAMRLDEADLEELIRTVAVCAWRDLRLRLRGVIRDAGGVTNLPVELLRDPAVMLELLQDTASMSTAEPDSALRLLKDMRDHRVE